MSTGESDPNRNQSWESVHVYPNCGHIINLAELDMKVITTGMVTCPSGDWSGQIEIQVVEAGGKLTRAFRGVGAEPVKRK